MLSVEVNSCSVSRDVIFVEICVYLYVDPDQPSSLVPEPPTKSQVGYASCPQDALVRNLKEEIEQLKKRGQLVVPGLMSGSAPCITSPRPTPI